MVHVSRKQVGQLTSNTSENPGTVGQRPRATLANHSRTAIFVKKTEHVNMFPGETGSFLAADQASSTEETLWWCAGGRMDLHTWAKTGNRMRTFATRTGFRTWFSTRVPGVPTGNAGTRLPVHSPSKKCSSDCKVKINVKVFFAMYLCVIQLDRQQHASAHHNLVNSKFGLFFCHCRLLWRALRIL